VRRELAHGVSERNKVVVPMGLVFLVLLVLAYVLHMGSFGLIILGLLFVASMMSALGQKSSSWNDQAHQMRDEGEATRQKKTKMDGASMIGQYTRLCVKAEPDSLN
jgi:cbb3-type cytochrome oxidase subunit 3